MFVYLLFRLVAEKRIEFVSGGWSLPDEACTHYTALLSNFVEGHEFLRNEFGKNP